VATLRWAEVCDYVVEESRGKIGLIGLFDTLYTASFPAVHPDFWVASKLEGTPNERVAIEIDVVGPDGELISHVGPIEGRIGPGGYHYLVGRFMNARFEKEGRYEIRIRPQGGPPTNLTLWVRPIAEAKSPESS